MSDWEDDPEPPKPAPFKPTHNDDHGGGGGGGDKWGNREEKKGANNHGYLGSGGGFGQNGAARYNGRMESGGVVQKCHNCGGIGHMARECPSKRMFSDSNKFQQQQQQQQQQQVDCHKCGEPGHVSRYCPRSEVDQWGGGAGASKYSSDTWDNRRGRGGQQQNGFQSRGQGCYSCGQTGHIARDCSEPSRFQPTDALQAPKERYVPVEESDEALFKHGISSGINFSKYDNIRVEVSGVNPPHAVQSFEETGLRNLLMENIKRCGYIQPTPVQKYAIPIIMDGRDLMACAQTGSGKTAAFLLPSIHKLLADGFEPHTGHPQAPEVVVISPTRELATQIRQEARKFSMSCNIGTFACYGGTCSRSQAENLREKSINILVATPGRLLDYVNRDIISFRNVRFFVLDEADRMLDMGFMGDIDEIVRQPSMPPKGKRQTLMFSATFPDDIQRAASTYLEKYLFLKVGIVGGACEDITQSIHQVEQFTKREKLVSILREAQEEKTGLEKTLVFVEKKQAADFLASYLCQEDFKATSIHGDRLQSQREAAVRDFEKGRMVILVATAVAARGLDIPKVSHVLNYDLPKTIDEYVHRIGRTGRVGNTGRATSFYDPNSGNDKQIARDLVKILSQAQQEVPEWLQTEAQRAFGTGSIGGFGGYNLAGSKDIRQNRHHHNNAATANNGQHNNPAPSALLEEDEMWD